VATVQPSTADGERSRSPHPGPSAAPPPSPSGSGAPQPAPVARAVALPLPLALTTLVLTYWCVDIVSPALPDLQQSLALSGTGAGLVFACFFGGRLVGNLPAALLAGRRGPRPTAALGATTLLAGSLLAGVAGGEAALLPARALQGAGIAFLVTAGLLSLLRHRPAGGAAMTAYNVAAGVGSSAGLAAGGWLTGTVGWRGVFWLSSLLAVVLLAGAVTTRTRSGLRTNRSSSPPPASTDDPAPAPRGRLLAALGANLLVYANYSVWVVSLPLYASQRFGVGAEALGTLLLAVNFVHLFAAFPVGRAIRRLGAGPALTAGLVVAALGLLLVPAAPSAGWLLPPMVCYAVGQVAGNSAAGDLLLRLGGQGGRAVGLVRASSDVGLVVGPAAVGLLADAAGVAAPFPALALLTALGAALSWRLLTPPRP
jgi:MFS family permease